MLMWYDWLMYRRFLICVAAAAILLMVVPSMLETFDTWDKTPEIPVAGSDTETTLVVIGAAVGMFLGVAWLSVLLMNWLASLFEPLLPEPAPATQPHSYGALYLRLLFSPPLSLTSLRI